MISRRQVLKSIIGAASTVWLTQSCVAPVTVQDTPTQPLRATQTATGVAPHPANTLRVAFPGMPKKLDPAFYETIEDHQIGFAIYDGLVWIDASLTPQPMLAEAWEADQELQTWTFRLRQNVKFHHGAGLSAQDVVFTFERILRPQSGSTFASSLAFIKQIEAVDDSTVRFHLSTPSAELPLLLGAPQARILSQTYGEALLAKQPSGTGPFRFVQSSSNEHIRVTRNPAYWNPGHPQVETIDYAFIPYEKQVAALQAGQIDMMMQIGSADFSLLADDPAIAVIEIPSGSYQTIVMRATSHPFTDERVREALKYSVDRSAMQTAILKGHGKTGCDHPVSPISPFFAELPQRPYDPDKARTLLSQSGNSKGLKLSLITSTVRPGMEEMARAFQEMAKPAGIDISVVRVPASVYWSDYAGHVSFHTGNWGFRASIDETFMVAYHSNSKGNESNWRNPELDNLIDQARGEPLPDQRKQRYQDAQQLLMDKGAVIIPCFSPMMMAMNSTIQGFTPHPSGWLDFRNVSLH